VKRWIARSAVVLGALAAAAASAAGAVAPPKQRPLTEHWSCENSRTVDINYHPRREREPAWITYLGNRVEVRRKRAPDGNTFASKDGKVSWTEDGSVGALQYEGLLDAPVACRKTNKQREG
jgi:hypothetical protein